MRLRPAHAAFRFAFGHKGRGRASCATRAGWRCCEGQLFVADLATTGCRPSPCTASGCAPSAARARARQFLGPWGGGAGVGAGRGAVRWRESRQARPGARLRRHAAAGARSAEAGSIAGCASSTRQPRAEARARACTPPTRQPCDLCARSECERPGRFVSEPSQAKPNF